MFTKYLTALNILAAFILVINFPSHCFGQNSDPYAYDIGSPSVIDYYVSPTLGSDDNSGRDQQRPLRTVQQVWDSIQRNSPLTTGVRINLLNGSYGERELPNYWEERRGTASAPIIIRAAPGNSSVKFVRDINMAEVSYFYLLNIEIAPTGGGDTFHCERCDHILLRGTTLNGGSLNNGAHETVKVNQSQYIYLENNNIFFADDNAIDFVAVQYGHIIGNKIHSAQDWCIYVKGGSAYLRIEANEVYDCGVGGFTAGQGSGFQFMTSPWIHYEAYDIKFINNIVYNTEGAAFGVNGGYNVLLAYNTAYNIGRRSHLIEAVFGERTCDGAEDGSPNADCELLNAAGGWGAPRTSTTPESVGNRNVYIINNLLVNPTSVVSPQHFAVYGPRQTSSGSNLPSPQRADTNLVIKGNVIVNGTTDHPLGVGDSSDGCQDDNTTCSRTQLVSENSLNAMNVQFQGASTGDLRPVSGDALFSYSPVSLDAFLGGDRETAPLAPEGILQNSVLRDFSGAQRGTSSTVGAFSSSASPRQPQTIGESPTPETPGGGPAEDPLTISKISVSQQKVKKKVALTIVASVQGNPAAVKATVISKGKTLGRVDLQLAGDEKFRGKISVKITPKKALTVVVDATTTNQSASSEKAIKTK